MNKYVEILKELYYKYKDKIKIVVLPCFVMIAILFFWFNGNSKPSKVVYSDEGNINQQLEKEEKQKNSSCKEENLSDKIYVDIGGSVLNPGVYEVKHGTRLFKVIELAGGLLENANVTNINQAKEVFDGEKIIIPNVYDEFDSQNSPDENNSSKECDQNGQPNYTYSAGDEDKININMADANSLQTIPGIGPSKANKIIEYRKINGPFKSIDELKNISGIGEKTFDDIKAFLSIR